MVKARLEDTPYTLERRLGPTEVALRYGSTAILERWRLAQLPNITQSSYWIKVRRRWYRFAGQLS